MGEEVEFALRHPDQLSGALDAAVDQVDTQIARAKLPGRQLAAPE